MKMKKTSPNILLETCETFFMIREYETALPYLNDLLEYYRIESKNENKDQLKFFLDNLIKNVVNLIALGLDKDIDEIQSEEPLVWYNSACIYALQEKPVEARDALEKAIALNPIMFEIARDEEILKYIRNNAK